MPETKILLGFLTAHHPSRWHRRQVALCQFLKNSPLPFKFVFGDEIYRGDWERCGVPGDAILRAPGSDNKQYLHLKDQALFRYALENGFDYCLRGCDDTWVYPDRILKAGLEPFDYAGQFSCKFKLGGTFSLPFKYLNYAHGGCGIWLSRKAMEMLVAAEWDEHYFDSWPAKIDVGFGISYSKPDWGWDDLWIGEVLQGCLPYDHPSRGQPWEAYRANGISVYEDEMLFWNDEPQRPIAIHDPGVHKVQSREMDEVMEQVKRLNVAAAISKKIAAKDVDSVEEVSNAH